MKKRLSTGGVCINRDKFIRFKFNGQSLLGYQGDTIASALLANNIDVVARSFKYHRPRGIYSAGAEEPNAIFSVEVNGCITPNVRSTLTLLEEGMHVKSQSGWPSVNFDCGVIFSYLTRFLPAGFYYKTFMSPSKLWMTYEKFIRKLASRAPFPKKPDSSIYEHRHIYCDILIVGGGPSGIAAALSAAKSGADIIIADAEVELGGQLLGDKTKTIDGMPSSKWLQKARQELEKSSNVRVLNLTTIQGYYDYNYLIGQQKLPFLPSTLETSQICECLWKIRADRVILATGAIERPLVFANNDLPGVVLASSVSTYIQRYGVLLGNNILFFTNNDSVYASAIAASEAGARVEIIDTRKTENGYWQVKADERKIKVYYGAGIIGLLRTGNFLSARLGYIQNEWLEHFASHVYDTIAVSGGWTPTIHLFSQAQGQLRWSPRLGAFIPGEMHSLNPCSVVGFANGAQQLLDCLSEGVTAGRKSAVECGYSIGEQNEIKCSATPLESEPLYSSLIPTTHPVGRGPGKHFVDLMNDVTVADIQLSVREGYQSVEHMKRYTASGFGTDQGKTGNINAIRILAQELELPIEKVGHTTYRPPYTPMRYGLVAGHDRLENFIQSRKTAIDEWHNRNKAVYEDVGDWKRPLYFPIGDENIHEAVWRECKAVRTHVGVMDASTLGKIDIQGPDAAQFLDMIYTNLFSSLAVGSCRYGLMLRETGMIFDDGVTARLGENHFHMTTSTGHAASVMNWLEEWLQTEWPQLKVFCTSVTEQWAVIALAGQKARELLSEVTDISLKNEDFPFMTFREGKVCGVPARVFRISFSGETAFEINVPARFGLSVWETLFAHGERHNITAYGTESMHVLRAEKGYIIVGQDSDGTMIPEDIGLSWMVSKKKEDFIGKRSLSRSDMKRPDRWRLVGLLSEEENEVIPEGAHLISNQKETLPTKPQGFVSSSYMSPTLERSFALALLSNGANRHGEVVYALTMDNKRIKAVVTDTVFWDKEGVRLRG